MDLTPQQNLIETAVRMVEQSLVRGTWGNISCRLTAENQVLITPSGMQYETMTVDDLVVIDLQGQIVCGNRKPSTEKMLHALIYRNRPEIGAIVHTHSVYATAFACAGRPIPAVTEEIAQFIGGPIPVTPYVSCGSSELAEIAVHCLGQGSAVLLANHGLVGVGKDLDDALLTCIVAEKTAQIAAMACILGGYQELSSAEVDGLRDRFLNQYGQRGVKL